MVEGGEGEGKAWRKVERVVKRPRERHASGRRMRERGMLKKVEKEVKGTETYNVLFARPICVLISGRGRCVFLTFSFRKLGR